MVVPLIVQTDVLSMRVSPIVYLLEGEWEIISNHKESLLMIQTETDISPTPYKEGLRIKGGQMVSVKFLNPVKETVSVSARLCPFQ